MLLELAHELGSRQMTNVLVEGGAHVLESCFKADIIDEVWAFLAPKLLDANERKHRDKCTLFICEGDSAIGGLRSARNKLYQGGIALKGKPMNVAQANIKEILDNQEFSDIMASIGLVIGQQPDFKKLRY